MSSSTMPWNHGSSNHSVQLSVTCNLKCWIIVCNVYGTVAMYYNQSLVQIVDCHFASTEMEVTFHKGV